MDTLIIKSLNVSTQIGVYEWEQKIKQNLLIDITIPYDFSACNDDLSQTIDYEALCRVVTTAVESQSFRLIETVANTLASLIQQEFKVKNLSISVSKPNAVANAGVIQVHVER
ncbi:MAG: dihydroneopterin aldolase [Legionella sp.]|jgi:dihydroneopterin aldolase